MSSRRRYLSALALLVAGCSSDGDPTETTEDGPPNGTPTDAPTDDATPTPEVETLQVDHPVVAWAARLPRDISYAPAVDGERVFVPLGREALGTPNESDDSRDGALVGLAVDSGDETWRTSLDAPLAADLSLGGDTLRAVTGYATATAGVGQRVHGFDLGGTQQWATDPYDSWLSVVATDEETTFVATSNGTTETDGQQLFAAAADGSVAWERDAGNPMGATVAGDSLLYNNADERLVAYGLAGGDERWSATGRPIRGDEASVAVVGQTCFTMAAEETETGYPLVARAVSDGSERWRYSVDLGERPFVPVTVASIADTDGAPAIVGTEAAGTVFALDANGEEQWRYGENEDAEYDRLLVGDVVYVTTTNGVVVGLDPASGEEQWRYQPPAGASTVRVADSGLFVYPGRNQGDQLTAVGPDGEERWRFELPSGVSASVATGDRLYAVVEAQSLYAFAFGGGA